MGLQAECLAEGRVVSGTAMVAGGWARTTICSHPGSMSESKSSRDMKAVNLGREIAVKQGGVKVRRKGVIGLREDPAKDIEGELPSEMQGG